MISPCRCVSSVPILFKQFSLRHNHLAIVKNSQGENVGMVTFEDVVEDITDEFDKGLASFSLSIPRGHREPLLVG